MSDAAKHSSEQFPKVAIILVNLNQEGHTRECIESLSHVTYRNTELVLVDNGSVDGSGDRLHTDFPTVTYLPNKENLGFAGGNNTGIEYALNHGADYVMLLNNDTLVDPGFIEPLVDYALANPSTGFQSCKIYYHFDPNLFWYAGGIYDIAKAKGGHRGMQEHDAGQYDIPGETAFATGCMMMASADLIRKIGMLENSFFIYYEDVDWCLRARKAGKTNIYNAGSKIWHKVSATTKIDSPFYLYLTMRNKILMLRRHSSFAVSLPYFPFLVYFFSRQLIRMSLKWHSWKGTRAVWYGILDGVRNFTGEGGRGSLSRVLGN